MYVWKLLAHHKIILKLRIITPFCILTQTNNTAEPLMDGLLLERTQGDSLTDSETGELCDCFSDIS